MIPLLRIYCWMSLKEFWTISQKLGVLLCHPVDRREQRGAAENVESDSEIRDKKWHKQLVVWWGSVGDVQRDATVLGSVYTQLHTATGQPACTEYLVLIMWLYVGLLWSQGADDMWVSDGDGRAGCSSLAYERRRQCPIWNSVKWKERYRKG